MSPFIEAVLDDLPVGLSETPIYKGQVKYISNFMHQIYPHICSAWSDASMGYRTINTQ